MSSKKPIAQISDIDSQIKYDQKIVELKSEITDLKRKYNQALKVKSIEDEILDFSKKVIKALPTVSIPRGAPHNSTKTKESVVLVGSCWHIGEVINNQQMDGLNEYNFDIFIKRLQFLVEKTISFTTENMSNHSFEELVVLLTGDMVSGIIHTELETTNELNIVEQATLGALVVAQALLELASVFPKIRILGVVGNHGRTTPQKYFKNKQQVNWDYIFYQNLAMLLKDQKNIKFEIPLSFFAFTKIQEHDFLVLHGDTLPPGVSNPVNKLSKEASKWQNISAVQDKSFEYIVASHYHTKATMQTPNGECILNASLKGGDEYALALGLYSDPIQMLFGVHETYGKTWEISLNAKYTDLSKPLRYKYSRLLPLPEQLQLLKK